MSTTLSHTFCCILLVMSWWSWWWWCQAIKIAYIMYSLYCIIDPILLIINEMLFAFSIIFLVPCWLPLISLSYCCVCVCDMVARLLLFNSARNTPSHSPHFSILHFYLLIASSVHEITRSESPPLPVQAVIQKRMFRSIMRIDRWINKYTCRIDKRISQGIPTVISWSASTKKVAQWLLDWGSRSRWRRFKDVHPAKWGMVHDSHP